MNRQVRIMAVALVLVLSLPFLLCLAPTAKAEGEIIDFINITGFKPVAPGLPVTTSDDISLNDERLRIVDMYCYVVDSSPTEIHDTFVAGTEYCYRIEIEVADKEDTFVYGMNKNNVATDTDLTVNLVNFGSTDVKKVLVYVSCQCDLVPLVDLEAYGITAPVQGLRLPGKDSFVTNEGVVIDSISWSLNGRSVYTSSTATEGSYRLYLTLGTEQGRMIPYSDLESGSYTVTLPGTSATVAMVMPNFWYEERLNTVSIDFVPMNSVKAGWSHETAEAVTAFYAPSSSAKVCGTLDEGTPVKVSDIQNGWACIGVGEYMAWVPAETLAALPSAPSVRVVNGTSGLELAITPVAGSASFRVLRRTPGGSYTTLTETEEVSYTDASAEAGTLYEYAVQALDADGNKLGPVSDAVRGLRLGKSTVSLDHRVAGVHVAWSPVPGADSYEVLRLTEGDYVSCGVFTGTEAVINGISEGEEVTVIVRPRRTAGGTVWYGLKSAERKITLCQPVPQLTAVNVARGVKLTWTQVTGAESYRVYRSVNGSDYAYLTSAVSNTINDSNARTNGAVYRYKVTAGIPMDGKTVYSPESNEAVTVFLTAPTLSGMNRLSGVQLVWKAVDGAQSYVLARNGTVFAETASTGCVDTDVARASEGTEFKYTAYARMTYEGTEYTSAASSTLRVSRATQVPTVTAVREGGCVRLTWTEVEEADRYEVLLYVNGQESINLGYANGTTMLVSGASYESGDKLAFRVRSLVTDADTHEVIGAGAYSENANYTWLDTPQPAVTENNDTYTLSWAEVPGAQHYEVWVSINGNTPRMETELYSTCLNLDDLEPGSLYSYTLRSKVSVNGQPCYSEFSDSVSVQTTVKVGDVSAEPRADGVYLSWSAFGTAERLQMNRRINDGYAVITDLVPSDARGWLDTALEAGDVVSYEIRAITLDSHGLPVAGEWSDTVHAAYLPAPAVSVSFETLGARVSWTPVVGAQGYVVRRRTDASGYEPVARVADGHEWLDDSVTEGDTVGYSVTPYTDFRLTTLYGLEGGLSSLRTVTVPTAWVTAELTDNGTRLAWTGVPGADSYRVERSLNGSSFAVIAQVADCGLMTETAPAGTVAAYRVRAVQQSTVGPCGNTARAVRVSPACLTAEERVGEVRLAWTVPASADGVKVCRVKGTSEQLLTVASADGEFSDSEHGVLDTGSVTYRIYAYKADNGTEFLSPAVDVTCTVSNPRPELNIWSTSGGILLNWTEVPWAECYSIRRGADVSGMEECAVVESCEWTDTVSPDTWLFEVTPMARDARGSWLRGQSSLVTSPHRLSRVDGLTAQMMPVGAEITWRAVRGADDYMVYRTLNGVETAAAVVTEPHWVDTQVPDGASVTYTVRGRKLEQGVMVDGLLSDALTVTMARTRPLNLRLDDSGPNHILWDAMPDACGFRVYCSVNGGAYALLGTADGNGFTMEPVTGQYRKVRVSALCRVNGQVLEGPCSAETSIMRLGSTAVTGRSVFGGLALSWDPVTGARAYRVYTLEDGVRTLYTETAETECFYAAADGTAATFAVEAVSTWDGITYTSPAAEEKTLTAAAPSVTLTGSADGTALCLRWTRAEGADRYEVYRCSPGGSFIRVAATRELTYSETAGSGSLYTYKILPVGTTPAGEAAGRFSSPVTLQSVSAPVIHIQSTPFGLELSWAPVAGAEAYRVERVTADGIRLLTTGSAAVFLDRDAAVGLPANYRVTAIGSFNGTEAAAEATGTRSCDKAMLTASCQGPTATLSWTAVAGAEGYRVYLRTASGRTLMAETEGCAAVVDVPQGKACRLTVCPLGRVDGRLAEGEESAPTAAGWFAVPTIRTACTLKGLQITVSGTDGADRWAVTRTVNGVETSFTFSGSTYLDTEVKSHDNLTYTLSPVSGRDDWLLEGSSARAHVTYVTASPVLTAALKGTTVTVDWTEVPEAELYQLEKRAENGEWRSLGYYTTGRYSESVNLNPGQLQEYRVRALTYDYFEGTTFSETDRVIVVKAPGLVLTENRAAGVYVSWYGAAGAQRYRVERSVNGGGWVQVDMVSTAAFTDTEGIPMGAEVRYRITSMAVLDGETLVSPGYESAPFIMAAFTTVPVVEQTEEGIVLTWPVINGARYRVETGSSYTHTILVDAAEENRAVDTNLQGTRFYRVTALGETADGTPVTGITGPWVEFTPVQQEIPEIVDLPDPVTPEVTLTADGGCVTLRWAEDENADRYEIYSTVNGGAEALAAVAETNTWTASLEVGLYTFRVKALRGTGEELAESGFSPSVELNYIPSTDVTVSNTAGGVTVTWPTVDGVYAYQIWRRVNGGAYQKLKSIVGSRWEDTDVSAGQVCTYKVRSYIKLTDGNLAYSSFGAEASVTYLSRTSLKLTNGVNGITVKWDKVNAAHAYQIWRSVDGGLTYAKVKSTTALSWNDTDIEGGIKYTYKVRAYVPAAGGGNDYSEFSDELSLISLHMKAVNISNVADGILLEWETVNAATGYQIWRSVNGGAYQKVKSIAGTRWEDTGVSAGRVNTYKVRWYMKNSNGELTYSDFGAEVSISYLPTTALKLTNGVNGITVKWDEVSAAHAYQIWRSDDGGVTYAKVKSTTALSWNDTGVKDGIDYTYKVRAYVPAAAGGNDYSAYSDERSLVSLHLDDAELSNVANGILLEWEEVEGAKAYQVFKADESGTYSRVKTVTATEWTDTDVESGEAYSYKIRAYASTDDGTDYSAYFTELEIRFVEPPEVTANRTSSGAVLRWDAVDGASAYQIWRKEANGEMVKVKSVSGRTWTDTAVKKGVAYTYYVRAYYNSGSSLTYSAFDSVSL